MKRKKAIVTIAIGKQYLDMFESLCKKHWMQYCGKHKFDLIVIKNPLDGSERAMNRSIAWQKLLILSQEWSQHYDQIVWIDTDILINLNNALDICQNIPIDKVSAVEAWSIPSRHIHDIALKRLYQSWDSQGVKYVDNLSPRLYYQNRGIDNAQDLDAVVQTGVFICSPSYHRQIFEHIYHTYEDKHGAEWNYEMPAMSYEIIKNNLHNWINPEYNFCVSNLTAAFYPFIFHNNTSTEIDQLIALKNIYDLGYFVHFAGCSSYMTPFYTYLKNLTLS